MVDEKPEPIEVNMPFARVPQHEGDPGFGPVPPRPKVKELFPKAQAVCKHGHVNCSDCDNG
jgi:hypothetical protein